MGEKNRLEYIKVTIHTTTQGAEALAAALPALGINGFSVEDPADMAFIMASKEALAWDYIDSSAFDEKGTAGEGEALVTLWLDQGSESKVNDLRMALMKLKSDEQYGMYGEDADFGRLWLDAETVRNDWKDKYKEGFRTFSPCEGIVISPPWENHEARQAGPESPTGHALYIVIDPGMAFGTGTHETTTMCLIKLKELLSPGDLLLDAGTGSGILAIAAAKLGAAKVHAVEIDPDAAGSAARNIEANGVRDTVYLITGDLAAEGTLDRDTRYDLITANLSCPLLEALMPLFKRFLKDDGAMILSGLLDAQEERAIEMLEDEGLSPKEVRRNGEWLMIEARK